MGGRGGGIDHNATSSVTLAITNSTISGNNSGGGGGGGIFATLDAATTIVGSTIAGNTTTGNGGGIRLSGTNATLSENTIYAFNTSGTGNENCGNGANFVTAESNIDSGVSCGFGTGSGNQESVSAGALGLGALASNGGLTQTRALGAGSIALEAASADCGGLANDQRGVIRPQGVSCDIGAFELEVATPDPPVDATPITQNTPITPLTPVTPAAPKKCKKGRKLKKGKCVKRRAKKK